MTTAVGIEADEIEMEPIRTVADLLAKHGDIPPERILMTPVPGTATEADAIQLADRADKRLCELVNGTLVEQASSFHSSVLAAWIGYLLWDCVDGQNLGFLLGASGMARMTNANVRMPDVSFFSWEQCGSRTIPDLAMMPVAPELAVEILSSSNTGREMRQKREEYFASGTRLVWESDPRSRTVRVFANAQDSVLLTEDDRLTGGDVLPGFDVAVREVFGKLDPRV